jgi:pimeloyl-ACP methyl ester carboxylesterase
MKKKIVLAASIFVAILLLAVGGFVVWASADSGPMPEAVQALESTSAVKVETDPWLVFTPIGQEPTTGFIFYPGGKVDPRSYAPMAKAIAEQGYLVVIPPMPLNLAVFSPDEAAEVIAAYPSIETWVIGGHSLGGSMAANYAKKHPEQISGLMLQASYPASSDDLSLNDIQVLSMYGTNDQVADYAKIEASKALLPPDTQFIPVEGGNHAGFGWYGPQSGDGEATISREEQQAQVVQAIIEFLEKVGAKNVD